MTPLRDHPRRRPAGDPASTRRRLLAWYRRHRRDLPWRRSRDPYAIWVSEIMLQQTTVASAVPFFECWMERFPTLTDLARADEEEVLSLWAGLGYYNRVRNLQRAAQRVLEEFGGRIPDDVAGLRSLPGVGPYTAGAIASIAFGRRVPAVDANVNRVVARLFAVRADLSSAVVQQILWEHAAELAQTAKPGDLNQALMELGALICSPAAPNCPACPLRSLCAAHRRGDPERYPSRPSRPDTVDVTAVGAVIQRAQRHLILRRPAGGRMGGMWEFPNGPVRGREPGEVLAPLIREMLGLEISVGEPLTTVEHTFTHHRIALHVWLARVIGGRLRRRDHAAHRWATLQEIARRPMATPQRRIAEAVLDTAGRRQLDLLTAPSRTPIDISIDSAAD